MEKKTILIAIVIVIVVLIGGWAILNSQNPNNKIENNLNSAAGSTIPAGTDNGLSGEENAAR